MRKANWATECAGSEGELHIPAFEWGEWLIIVESFLEGEGLEPINQFGGALNF